jgi:hypothetical protein
LLGFSKAILLNENWLPARLNHTGQQALVSHFAEDVARDAKVAVVGAGAAGQPAAIMQPVRSTVKGELLQLAVQIETRLLGCGLGNLILEVLPLLSVLGHQALALFLPLNHTLLGHETSVFPFVLG